MKTVKELIELLNFPIEERSPNKLHSIYDKHLPACWIIEQIYGGVENGTISLGKARELTASVIEHHNNGTLKELIYKE